MYKRIVILFLLLTSVSFYSCSTKKKVKKPRKKDIIIPESIIPEYIISKNKIKEY